MSEQETEQPVRRVIQGEEAQSRILDAVDELFYQEGARAVGVDAVVKKAGVNKMSLYRQFVSKDALLLHYLNRRTQRFWAYFDDSVAQHPDDPGQQLVQLLRDLSERGQGKNYRGCPFVNIAVEFPDPAHPARLAVAANKTELLERLQSIAQKTTADDPELLANSFALLIEGAYAATQTYPPGHPLIAALPKVAQAMVDAACSSPAKQISGKP